MEHPLAQFKFCPKCGSPRFEVHNGKSKHCADCGFTYYFNPSSATVALIQNGRGELLVCRRGKEPAKGTLDLPGGFVDMFETGEEGVIREVKEETGLDVQRTQYLFSLPNLYLYSGFLVHTLDMFFRCTVADAGHGRCRRRLLPPLAGHPPGGLRPRLRAPRPGDVPRTRIIHPTNPR